MKTKINIIMILTLLLTLLGAGVTPAQAAPGDLDLTFGTGGQVDTGVTNGGDLFVLQAPSVQQSDGKILVAGFDYSTDGWMQALLERYTADGALDAGFGTDGRLYPQVAGYSASYLAGTHIGLQDEILAVGGAGGSSGSSLYLARYDSAGVPLAGFGTDGILLIPGQAGWNNVMPTGTTLQSDGKLLIAGSYGIYDDLELCGSCLPHAPGPRRRDARRVLWQRRGGA